MIVLRALLFAVVLAVVPLAPSALCAADQPPVNTICPVTGKPVDTTIPAVIVTVGKGERVKRFAVGIADRAAAEQVKANPGDYIEAAKANRKAK